MKEKTLDQDLMDYENKRYFEDLCKSHEMRDANLFKGEMVIFKDVKEVR